MQLSSIKTATFLLSHFLSLSHFATVACSVCLFATCDLPFMNGVAEEEKVQHLFRVTRMGQENELWPVANKLQQLQKERGA